MRQLPREVDRSLVHNMSTEDPGNINYSDVGGLGEQIRELREVSGVTSGRGQHVTKFRCGCGIFVRRNFVIICECLEWAVCVAELNVLCVAKFIMWVWSCYLGDRAASDEP